MPVSSPQSVGAPFEITALLGRGTRFEGKLFFEGSVRIDGELHGVIRSDDTLVIGEGAEVFAEVHVGTLIVRGGALYGNVRARVAIELYAPGKVVGDLHSPSISIERGVAFRGQCRMDILDEEASATLAPVASVAPVAPVATVTTAARESELTVDDLDDDEPTHAR